MRQIGSGITGSQVAERMRENATGLQPGATGSGVRDPETGRRNATVIRCLRRLNLSRRKAGPGDWTKAEMDRPEFLRPVWVVDGDTGKLRAALSSTCSQAEAARLVKVLRGLTRMSNEQMSRAEIMVTGFVTKLSAYPPLVAAEVVSDWTETQEFFPGSWATLKNELDYVMGALEAYAR